ncbi:LADA_0H06810g1_1 [Lachancea dasiensis]|uniref:Protein kinase C-like 1 n=1 Tax=Lachancea dasiensis TaxID=1072105 RepID=A0A1G4K1U3_9SACH|nr:LADA_0H06810g1_1 [Lachancea dasiensis]
MLTEVEQEIRRKVEREFNIIQGATQLKKKTDNVMVIQKCNTNIREAQQNIHYLEETLKKLQLKSSSDTRIATETPANQAYGQLSTIAPDEHIFSRLDLMKYDCPSLSQRIQYMLQQLEFKLQVEEQYQEANDKLTKLYQIDGDRRSSSAAEGGSKESKLRINLLKKSLKKYQAINVDLDQFKHAADQLQVSQPKFRRNQLTGTLTIAINAIRDVDHVQSPMFSRKPDTFVTIKIDDTLQARTRVSRTDRWQDEFNIAVGKGNEIEITVYDRVNDQTVPVAQMWLLLSDIAEEIRKKKAGQTGQIDWSHAARVTSPPLGTESGHITNDAAKGHVTDTSNDGSPLKPVSTSLWFVLEPAGQILVNLGFSKSSAPTNKHLTGGLHRHGAIINRKEEVYEQHGHHFVHKSFYNIMRCAYCGDFLRYSGYQCQDCKFLCHRKCYKHVVTKCIAKASSDADSEEPQLNHCIPHRFEPVSNRGTKWCCHCGYILPWGKKHLRKCSECGIMCHTQCAHLVPDFCGMSMDMANQILTAIQDTRKSQQEKIRLQAKVTPELINQKLGREGGSPSKATLISERGKPLPLSPTHTDFANIIARDRPTELTDKERFNLEPTEVYKAQEVKAIVPEGHRDKLRNSRLNNFIEENTDYKAFTDGAHHAQSAEPDEGGRTLDPAYAYDIVEGKLKLPIGDDSHLGWGDRTKEEQEYLNHTSPSLDTPHDVRDVTIMDLDTKGPQYGKIESLRNNSHGPLSSTLQPQVDSFTLPHANQQAIIQEDSLALQIEKPLVSADESEAQHPSETLPASRSPQHPHTTGKHKKRTPKRRKISLDDFVLLKVLGKGNFGKVLLAKSKNNERLCAIKVLKKDHIIKNHDIESARAEKKVFLLATKAKHPFLTNLYCSFQTENRIYFAMEFIGGGDLMWHVQNQRLSVRRAKFYAAEVLLALKYFHDNGVIYRDLKLENILLTPEGHIKIADYGLCKDEMWFGNKTSTFCGTPEFMAPEILKEQEYTKAVDWWAFGVLLYQMLLCQSPFSGDDEDEVFNAILTDEPLYPIDMAGDIVQIFQGLLTKDPERRLGAGPRDAAEVMAEPFFRNINFDDIINQRVQPPYIPEIKAADDTSYFEKEFTSAPPTLTPLPSVLSSNLQEEFRGFSFMPEDLLL